ncbi:cation transporter [Lutibacter sp. B2]|nr:cation transporter [Lutibacter sp. B2]
MSSIHVEEKERLRIANKILLITIILNVFLTIIKVVAGYLGKSTAILADGLHSGSDIITSIGVIFGMVVASKPRDENHPYGHEKAESIAGFLLASILTITGIEIGYQSVKMIILENYQTPQMYTAIIACISIFIKEYQYRITLRTAKKINSNAMMSDAWHHRSDALSSIAALVGIIGSILGYKYLDPLAGIAVSAIVIKVGIDILSTTVNELMDGTIEQEKLNQLNEEIIKLKGVRNITDLRARRHGSKVNVDIRICVNPLIPVYEGHTIGEEAEHIILNRLDNVKEVIVHIDPCEYKETNHECNHCKDD